MFTSRMAQILIWDYQNIENPKKNQLLKKIEKKIRSVLGTPKAPKMKKNQIFGRVGVFLRSFGEFL